MFKSNNSIVANKGLIGWNFSSNKYVCMDAYLTLKSRLQSLLNMYLICHVNFG